MFFTIPVSAKNPVKSKAVVQQEFQVENAPEIIEFTNEENIITDKIGIPKNSKIKALVFEFQKEKRWHKSGFIIAKLLDFTLEGVTVDLESADTFLIMRKYEPIDPKEAAIITIELLGSSAVAFFAPGTDIAYFFIKGAILRKKHPNWFKAGVFNAYDNSIFWFFEKGKPIDLVQGDEVKLKYVERNKAHDMKAHILYKKDKIAFRKEKKIVAKEVNEIRDEIIDNAKKDYKISKKTFKEEKKIVKGEVKEIKKELLTNAHLEYKNSKTEFKKEKRIVLKDIKEIKKELKEEEKIEIAQFRADKKLIKQHKKIIKMMAKSVKKRQKLAKEIE